MAQQAPPQLSPSELFDSQAQLDSQRLTVYNRILSAVHERIRFVSRNPNADQMTAYDFPEWHPGCPRFDVKDCILYVAWNLRHSGFKVLYVSPNRLLISWKDQALQYYQEESPIRQAMLAIASPQAQAPRPVEKVEKKKAGAYKPPAEGVAGLLASGGAMKRGGSTTITFI